MAKLVLVLLLALVGTALPWRQASAACLLCSCSAQASGVAFSTYSPLQTSATNSTGTISISCSLSGAQSLMVSYQIALSTGSSGSYTSRRMTRGTANLIYNLYTNSARTQVWGNGTGGSSVVSDSYVLVAGPATKRTYTTYGRVSALQNVAAGSYSDTIVVTVTY